jgi:hypothetical protein
MFYPLVVDRGAVLVRSADDLPTLVAVANQAAAESLSVMVSPLSLSRSAGPNSSIQTISVFELAASLEKRVTLSSEREYKGDRR